MTTRLRSLLLLFTGNARLRTSHFALRTILLLCAGSLFAQKTSVQNIEPRVEALLARMTVEEKIGQLTQVPGDISTGTDVAKDDLLNQIRSGKIGSILSHQRLRTYPAR